MRGKTMLVTDGGIGIGRSVALASAQAGYRVIVMDVLEDEGSAVAASINAAGGKAEFHPLDIRSTAQTDAFVATVEAAHGPLEVVVANAGNAHKVSLAELSRDVAAHARP